MSSTNSLNCRLRNKENEKEEYDDENAMYIWFGNKATSFSKKEITSFAICSIC